MPHLLGLVSGAASKALRKPLVSARSRILFPAWIISISQIIVFVENLSTKRALSIPLHYLARNYTLPIITPFQSESFSILCPRSASPQISLGRFPSTPILTPAPALRTLSNASVIPFNQLLLFLFLFRPPANGWSYTIVTVKTRPNPSFRSLSHGLPRASPMQTIGSSYVRCAVVSLRPVRSFLRIRPPTASSIL